MSRGINKVIIVGNLGCDPESRAKANGSMVVKFSVATSESWKDKQTGEKKEETEWHNIVAFGKLAEICANYLKKGTKVYVEGKLKTRKWEDNQGVTRYSTDIVASEMQMLGNRQGAETSHSVDNSGFGATQPTQSTDHYEQVGGFDDDIPF